MSDIVCFGRHKGMYLPQYQQLWEAIDKAGVAPVALRCRTIVADDSSTNSQVVYALGGLRLCGDEDNISVCLAIAAARPGDFLWSSGTEVVVKPMKAVLPLFRDEFATADKFASPLADKFAHQQQQQQQQQQQPQVAEVRSTTAACCCAPPESRAPEPIVIQLHRQQSSSNAAAAAAADATTAPSAAAAGSAPRPAAPLNPVPICPAGHELRVQLVHRDAICDLCDIQLPSVVPAWTCDRVGCPISGGYDLCHSCALKTFAPDWHTGRTRPARSTNRREIVVDLDSVFGAAAAGAIDLSSIKVSLEPPRHE